VPLADAAAESLRRIGAAVDRLAVGPGLPELDRSVVDGADVVAVAGGDGTVLSVAPVCASTGVPIYHLAAGNENLFSREFGMRGGPERLLGALRRRRVARCDIGWCAPGGGCGIATFPFLLMASVGPDASVVHRLHERRRRAVGHRAYLGPVIEELRTPSLPRLRVWCDGAVVFEGRGMAVAANCRQYGSRVNICRDADMCDGVLDVTCLPAETSVETLAGLVRLRIGLDGPEVVRARGRRVRIEAGTGARVQVDGEAAMLGVCLDLGVERGVLPVLDAR